MAEVRKRKEMEKYKIDDAQFHKNDNKKQNKGNQKKENGKKDNSVKVSSEKKKSLWVRFRIFCHGVKSEAKKVHWPTRKDMVKYSVATVAFIIFCSLFVYIIDIIFALIQSIFK